MQINVSDPNAIGARSWHELYIVTEYRGWLIESQIGVSCDFLSGGRIFSITLICDDFDAAVPDVNAFNDHVKGEVVDITLCSNHDDDGVVLIKNAEIKQLGVSGDYVFIVIDFPTEDYLKNNGLDVQRVDYP